MSTNHLTTSGTDPFLFLFFDKMSDPKSMYHIEIINHTHSIPGPVSFIQLLQPDAGETFTSFRTKLSFAFGELITVTDIAGVAVF
jgi:hypothetical protein